MAMTHFEALSVPRLWMVNVSAKYNVVLWFKVPHSKKNSLWYLEQVYIKDISIKLLGLNT